MGHLAEIGIVTGLPLEARTLRASLGAATPPILCSGADASRAATAAAQLIGGGCELLVSFGFAAGLVPSLAAGDIVLADRVVTCGGGVYDTDKTSRTHVGRALDGRGSQWQGGLVAGVNCVLDAPETKRKVASATGALAADMESHGVAAAAGDLPFIVLRVVVDPAARAIPPSVLAALATDGGLRAGPLIGGLLRRPREIAQLAALIGDSARARPALRRAAAALGEAFGLR